MLLAYYIMYDLSRPKTNKTQSLFKQNNNLWLKKLKKLKKPNLLALSGWLAAGWLNGYGIEAEWLAGWLADWLVAGQLVSWLASCCLAGWLADSLVTYCDI